MFFLLAFSLHLFALRNEEWLVGCHGLALFAWTYRFILGAPNKIGTAVQRFRRCIGRELLTTSNYHSRSPTKGSAIRTEFARRFSLFAGLFGIGPSFSLDSVKRAFNGIHKLSSLSRCRTPIQIHNALNKKNLFKVRVLEIDWPAESCCGALLY